MDGILIIFSLAYIIHEGRTKPSEGTITQSKLRQVAEHKPFKFATMPEGCERVLRSLCHATDSPSGIKKNRGRGIV